MKIDSIRIDGVEYVRGEKIVHGVTMFRSDYCKECPFGRTSCRVSYSFNICDLFGGYVPVKSKINYESKS